MLIPVVVAGCAFASALHQAGPHAADSSPELLLVDVLYEHLRVDTSLTALQDSSGRRFLPMRQICGALGFRVHVDAKKRLIEGFVSEPTDRLSINVPAGRCAHRDRVFFFDPTRTFVRDGDIYVDSNLLAQMVGLHFTWKLNVLELEVTSDTPLPIRQQWMERHLLDRTKSVVMPSLPVVRTPYSLWSPPSIDMQWYTDASVEDRVADTSSRLQFEGRGDLLFMSARYRYISGAAGKPSAELLTLSRSDPEGRLLGSMGATEIALGDLNLAQVPLFARARNGLGISVSSFALPGTREDDDSSIDGPAPAGSLVELYRGSEMLGSVRADADGRYRFSSIPLENGPNDLRVVVVTRDGDVREESRTLYGDAAGPAAGQSRYRLVAAKVGASLIPGSAVTLSSEQRRTEYIGEYQMGLTGSTWLATTLAQSAGTGFLGLGIHSWDRGNLWHLESMLSGNGGSALSGGLSRRLGRAIISLEHTLASPAFASRLVPEIGSSATMATRLSLDGSAGNGRHPVGYGFSLERFDGSSPSTLARARLSMSDGHTFLANTTALRLSTAPLDATGLLQIRRPLGTSLLRFDLGYGFGAERFLETGRFSLDEALSPTYRARFGFDYDATRLGRYESFGELYRVLGPLELGLNLSVDTRGTLRAGLLLDVGMVGDVAAHGAALTKPGATATGSVVARIYLDRNFDGRYDEGDQLLPGVGLRVAGHPAAGKSGVGGTCVVDRLAAEQQVRLELNEDSFEDPSWASCSPGVLVIPRSGRVVHLDLGVFESTEIEGSVEGMDLSAGLTAQLVDRSGKVAQTSVLDTAGTYVFSRVRPGDYTLRLIDAEGQPCGQRLVKVPAGSMMKDCDVRFNLPRAKPEQGGG